MGSGIAIVFVLFLTINLAAAHADLVEELTDDIKTQQLDFKEKQIILKQLTHQHEQLLKDSLQSWDKLKEVPTHKIILDAAKQDLKDSRSLIHLLISQRSDEIKAVKLAAVQIEIIEPEIITDQTRLIGIDLSKSCEISENCLNYSDLIHLDSSNIEVSGKFVWVNSDTRRDTPPFQDSWRWYDQDSQLRVIVDPPNGMSERIKMVTITNELPVFFMGNDMNLDNNTRTYHEGRYVDKCDNALIGAGNSTLLLDTIQYLRTNCTETTYNNTKSEFMIPSYYNPYTSPFYNYTIWLNESLEKCKGLCFEY